MAKVLDKVEEVAVEAVAVEDYGMEGFEEQELNIQSLPILQLAQSLTPEVSEGAIEGLKAGVLMNNTTKMPLGTEIELIVYKMWDGRTKFPPRGDNGPIDCWSPDGITGRVYGKCRECAFSAFDLKTDRCLDQKFFIVGLASNPGELYRLICSKSNVKAGKMLINVLHSECVKAGKAPIYAVKVMLSTKRVKNEKVNANYFIFEVKPSGLVPVEQLPELRKIYMQVTELRKAALDEFKLSLENTDDGSFEPDAEVVEGEEPESIMMKFADKDDLL